jgi:hypothetical protein
MSLLAPWFLAGAATIALPVLFHLIRRTVRNERPISTLMFLSAAPPLPSRRSRLEDLPLLIVRALMLALIAFAFTRPFLRSERTVVQPSARRHVAVVLDASASMRRRERWSEGERIADELIRDTPPDRPIAFWLAGSDLVSRIDRWDVTGQGSETAGEAMPSDRATPDWGADDLPNAVRQVLDRHASMADADGRRTELELHLISDFTSGDSAEWRSIEWPTGVSVRLHPVERPMRHDDAWLELLAPEGSADRTEYRVRVSNADDSTHDRFRLVDSLGRPEIELTLPPGRSRIVMVPGSQLPFELRLDGDPTEFGNRLFLPPIGTREGTLRWNGDPSDESAWIIRSAIESLQHPRPIWSESIADASDDSSTGARAGLACTLLLHPPEADAVETIVSRVRRGERLVIALDRPVDEANATEWEPLFDSLLPQAELRLDESPLDDFLLIRGAERDDPLLGEFAVESFRDFGEIHVWRQRRLSWRDAEPAGDRSLRVVAEFDDGSPWIVAANVGEGTVVLLTTGWTREESELGRSSRFAPLITTLIGFAEALPDHAIEDCDRLSLDRMAIDSTATGSDSRRSIADAQATWSGWGMPAPGAYSVADESGGADLWIVARIPASELDEQADDSAEIATWLPNADATRSELEQKVANRRLEDETLERTQGYWRWGLLAALVLSIAESWLGWRASTRITGERSESMLSTSEEKRVGEA